MKHTKQTLPCVHCGKVFTTWNIGPKYCSRACKAIATVANINHHLVADLYRGGMTLEEIAGQTGYGLKAISNSLKRQGVPKRRGIPRDQRGERNATWKGGVVTNKAGYRMVLSWGHPRADGNTGYVFEHILVMEKHLGRLLVWKGPDHPETEIVHHDNEDKLDNRIENLILTNMSDHTTYHNYLRPRSLTRE